jgi:hypothetical protein
LPGKDVPMSYHLLGQPLKGSGSDSSVMSAIEQAHLADYYLGGQMASLSGPFLYPGHQSSP